MTETASAQLPDLTFRPIRAEEFPAFIQTIVETFGEDPNDGDTAVDRAVFEPTRSLAAFDADTIVGTAAAFSRQLSVPGARALPIAAVSMVTVAPTHRRRGVLTAMMRRQLHGLHEQGGEQIAALWASEAGIYGRFGYGMATRASVLSAVSADLGFSPDVPVAAGRTRLVGMEAAKPHLAAVYEAQRMTTVGWLDRPARWWDYLLYDPEHHRRGATALRVVLHEAANGEVDGYAVYRIKSDWTSEGNSSEVQVTDIAATDPAAYAAVWKFLLGLDLVRRVSRRRGPVDEPLQHLVANPRGAPLRVADGLWVRLVDVPAALSARRYAIPLDVVLDVTDDFCPWNAGRYRLRADATTASCERTDGQADIALSSRELGAAYLGGTRLATLAAAGRVREQRPGALDAATTAFATPREPCCPEVF